jgi:hypothetical protein
MYHNREYLTELSEKFNEKIDFERLINVTYNIDTADVKFYTFSDELDHLKKYSKDEQINQYAAYKNKNIIPSYEKKIIEFLGYTPKFSEILIDVVMGDVVYFTTKMATKEEFKRFYKRLLQKFQIGEEEFFEALSFLNNQKVADFDTAHNLNCISVVKVPLKEGYFKVYAEPFKYGNSFIFNDNTKEFLEKLLSCSPLEKECLNSCITIYEFGTGRTQVSTQDEALKSKLFRASRLNRKFKFEKK